MENKINIIRAEDGKNIVVIDQIKFKGKRKINRDDVEEYLKEYVGKNFEIIQTADQIYIGADFPNEFANSDDTKRLMGTLAKAKANATQGIPELIEIATNKRFQENYKEKHNTDAKYGWYRYTSRFALPIYDEDKKTENYNLFRVEMLVKHSGNGKKYLYDMVNIKKETSKPL